MGETKKGNLDPLIFWCARGGHTMDFGVFNCGFLYAERGKYYLRLTGCFLGMLFLLVFFRWAIIALRCFGGCP